MNSAAHHRTLVVFVLVCLLAPPGAGAVAGVGTGSGVGAGTGSGVGGAASDVTFVENDVAQSTTWTADGGPYRVAADVTVRAGATLTIEPGTTVQPAEGVTITVRGNLTANGTANAPITVAPAPGAPAAIRWGGLRYEGTERSRLSLSHVTLASARDGVRVASPHGTVTIESSTFRTIERNAVRVAGTGGTPDLSVAGSRFAGVGARAVLVAPGRGAIADSRMVTQEHVPGNRTAHNASITPRADTTVRTVRLDYGGYGNLQRVDEDSFHRLGVDTDRDREVERFYNTTITSVDHPAPDELAVTLAEPVTVPAGASLVANYTNATNPGTFGTYPVEVRLQVGGVDRIAPTTLRLTMGSPPARPRPAWATRQSHASGFRITGSTFESIDGQAVFVAADVASYFTISGNEIAGVRGTGVTVRSRRISWGRVGGNRLAEVGAGGDGVRLAAQRVAETTVRRNRIAGADAGIRLVSRHDGIHGVRIASNAVTDSAVGLRVRAWADRVPTRISVTVVDNAFSGNRRHGVEIVGPNARLAGSNVAGNELAGNGLTGFRAEVGLIAHSTLADNAVVANGRAGAVVRAGQARETRFVDNEFRDNDGHGLALWTHLAVHNVSVASNRVLDNAGVGLDLRNQLTHAGELAVAENTVAANAYGVRVAGSLDVSLRNNTVVYNTYGFGTPDEVGDYDPGTGIIVEEGAAGALFEASAVEDDLAELVHDPDVEPHLPPGDDDPYAVVLRPDRPGEVRWSGEAALAVASLSSDVPTGIGLSGGDGRTNVTLRGNDVYGHDRGLVVNVRSLVDANTTTRLLADATRTVNAEHNYWGAPDGPVHSSIHPEGTGDRVVTERGWVDFVPPAESAFGQRHYRPRANLTVPADPARPGEAITLSGRRSTDRDGSVATYRFEIDGENRTTTAPDVAASFASPGNYTVALAVADDMGVESAARARATVAVREPTTTTVDPTTTVPDRTTTATGTNATTRSPTTTTSVGPSGPSSSGGGPLAAVFGTLPGLLGLALYGAGFLMGAYGTLQTLFAGTVTVSGRRINGLALGGVVLWVGAGLLGTGGLVAVGLGGLLLWVGLIAGLWVITRTLGS